MPASATEELHNDQIIDHDDALEMLRQGLKKIKIIQTRELIYVRKLKKKVFAN
jgi:hypothetical protein